MKKNLRFLTVILLAALCLLFAGCAEQAAEPDGSAQDLLNLNDGADEVPADDGLDDTADESYPAEEDLAAFAGTYTCRTQGAEWSDLEIYDDGSWTLYGTDATRTGTLVYEEEYEMYYAYNDADNSGCQFNRDESGEIYMGAYGYFVPTSAPSNEDAGGDGKEKVIYLTFDAGFENGYTASILDTLQAHNAPACFFVVGNYLETAPELVRRMVNEGHIVGNHTYHHYDMSKISDAASFRKELSDVETLYEQTTGEVMQKYYRPPQGIYSEENLRMAKQLGYRTVFWSLAYVDWYQDDQPTKEQAFSKLLPRIHPGAVVLLHSTSRTNAEILDELLTKWETMGYRFASLDELYEAGA